MQVISPQTLTDETQQVRERLQASQQPRYNTGREIPACPFPLKHEMLRLGQESEIASLRATAEQTQQYFQQRKSK